MSSSSIGLTAPFDLRIGAHGPDDLSIVRFRGIERLSRCYAFDVTFVVVDAGSLDEVAVTTALLEQEAVLRLAAPGDVSRAVRGVVTRVHADGADVHGRVAFRARIEPSLALLKKGQNSRIFQDQTLVAIVSTILGEHNVPFRFAFVGPHPSRVYCVQHRESDLAFIARICAEDGVSFWFESPADEAKETAPDVVAFGDSASMYPTICGRPTLAFRRAEGVAGMGTDESHVTRFSRRLASAPRGTRIRGYDFERSNIDLGAVAGDTDRRRVVYDHHDHDEHPEVDVPKATAMLEQARARSSIAEGAAWCRRLTPGHRFKLDDHDGGGTSGSYVATRVEHEGHQVHLSAGTGPVYEARFRCAPDSVVVRPRRPASTMRQVLETATVVGPPGEEIYTDEHGRIKVQFHWDLDGRKDDKSSCWLRVAQSWAGAGWGFQFIPRIGMEVLVSFLGGDLDRPVVIGALTNSTHVPPYKLPAERSKSGIRTSSTPGGGGHNELMFEDRAGAEQVSLRAERDLAETVQHDHTETVGHDKVLNVAGKHVLRVQGDRDDHVTGALVQVVDGGASISVSGDLKSQRMGNSSDEIMQNRSVVVHGSDSVTFHGESTTVVEGPHVVRVDGQHTLLVGEGRDDGQAEVSVSKKYLLSSGSTIRMSAEDSIMLSSGDSSIELTPKGVTIRAKDIRIMGSESTSLSGKGPAIQLADEAQIVSKVVNIYSESASIELDKNAAVKGKLILLNSGNGPPTSDSASTKPETQPFSIKLTDDKYAPYAGKKYKMVCEGQIFDGTTSGDGTIKADVPKGATTAQITLWLAAFPTGPMKRYSIQIEDLPDIGSVAGAQVRLKNLGYYKGAGKGETDDETRAAISSFQTDHAITPTGEMDDATKAALADRHES